MADLGLHNIEVRTGDGTLGWPDAAPFDAILAAAGGPEIPDRLQQQLAIGGRLIMPVGPTSHEQQLLRLMREGPSTYTREDLGAVRFVPLVGAFGWSETGQRP